MWQKLKCFLGFHNWINICTEPRMMPNKGEIIYSSELHECNNCKKQEYKGMGGLC